ncbi:DUF559 domain-containing protein [Thiorhodococcus fuscus]|uniref:DUF559 domain-containing protein n=1 Tax=Thiorhodococcus fuscus TaxID=527200 RepID=A0ABW4Y8U5_9GAMM
MRRTSALEETLAWQIRAARLPAPEREFRAVPTRRWRIDFAWPAQRVALEVEGGIWMQGRHTRPKGFEGDCEKYNEIALQGWRVLRVTGDMVRDGRALRLAERALERCDERRDVAQE